MYFPRNWEFSSALSKLRNFGGGGLNTPPRYAAVCHPVYTAKPAQSLGLSAVNYVVISNYVI
jgi:hypothetical protein